MNLNTCRAVNGSWLRGVCLAALCFIFLLAGTPAFAQSSGDDWQRQARESVRDHRLDAALEIVERRLAQDDTDLEARGCHARLLAWTGRWAEAEQEYRRVLDQFPNDTDILTGLADVLAWQHRDEEALSLLEHASAIAPSEPDILLRRGKLLREMGRKEPAPAVYNMLLLGSHPQTAKKGLASVQGARRHELRIGEETDTFNYICPAQAQGLALSSHWSDRWATVFGMNIFQRFGQEAAGFNVSTAYRLTKTDWVNGGGAIAHDSGVIPNREAFFEYGHGFRFHQGRLGLETSYQQHWLWYRGAHVLTLGFSQMYYLPKGWTWSLTVTGARSGFSGTTRKNVLWTASANGQVSLRTRTISIATLALQQKCGGDRKFSVNAIRHL